MIYSPKQKKAGYTLIEVMISGALLIVLLNICLSLFISFNRLRHRGEDIMDTTVASGELEATFRETMRTAKELPESFRDYKSSDSLLIVQDANEEAVTLLGNALNADEFHVVRWENTEGTWIIARIHSFDLHTTQFSFDRMGEELIRLSISLDKDYYTNSIAKAHTLYAALPAGGAL